MALTRPKTTEERLDEVESKIDRTLETLDAHRVYLYGELTDPQKLENSVRQQLLTVKEDVKSIKGEITGFKQGLNGGIRHAIYVAIGGTVTYVLIQLGLK